MEITMARLLSVFQAAKKLALAPATIRRMLWKGELSRIYPTARRGCVRVLEEEVENLITKGKVRREITSGGTCED